MKSNAVVLVSFFLAASFLAEESRTSSAKDKDFPGAAMPPVVHQEFEKTQHELQFRLTAAKKRVYDLEAEKTKAFARDKALAETETAGLALLKQYDTLVAGKYVDEHGDFQPGLELKTEDSENINKLLQSYVHAAPLFGRVSAGQGRRTIEWGTDQLKRQIDAHSSPSDKNDSDFEIIAKQIKDSEAEISTITAQADKLGIKLDTELVEVASPRAPASDAGK